MGSSYDSSELRREQKTAGAPKPSQEELIHSTFDGGDPIHYNFDNAGGRRNWTPMIPATIVLALGFLLAAVGPVPGLGMFLIIGAALAVPYIGLKIFLGD